MADVLCFQPGGKIGQCEYMNIIVLMPGSCLALDTTFVLHIENWVTFVPNFLSASAVLLLLGFIKALTFCGVQKIPLMALTATATPTVQMDIIKNLRLRTPVVSKTTFNRPNLR